ncbi:MULTISPECIES: serine hydrolase domain-containing protein [unclassified Bradyrhizobium]|uniref:serine hydrolase domain-containing protein n=1 Tax=unclassified Bradyrhizobium TaxID=2631580 RepID=UPI002915F0DC|nr:MULTISPECIES: serine hydrolase [unclassified Bradyrhizobium]
MIDSQVFADIVAKLKAAADKSGNNLKMDSLSISCGAKEFHYDFGAEEARADLRSVSKPILCMALGTALAKGLVAGGEKLTLETKVWPIFENMVALSNTSNLANLRKLRLKHLLNNTIGHHEGMMFRKDIEGRDESRLLDYIFNSDIPHEPGTYFVYSNAGPYLISALIQRATGSLASELVRKLIFDKLGIQNFSWKMLGEFCAGCTGLVLANRDLNLIGRVLADDGQFRGAQIVPASWVRDMKSVFVKTPTMHDPKRAFPKYGYGHYLWKTEDGAAYCDGTDGQYLILLKDGATVISTLGHQPDMKPITECFRGLL